MPYRTEGPRLPMTQLGASGMEIPVRTHALFSLALHHGAGSGRHPRCADLVGVGAVVAQRGITTAADPLGGRHFGCLYGGSFHLGSLGDPDWLSSHRPLAEN